MEIRKYRSYQKPVRFATVVDVSFAAPSSLQTTSFWRFPGTCTVLEIGIFLY